MDEYKRPSFIAKERGNLIIVQVHGDINAQTLPESQKMIDELIRLHKIYERKHLCILIDYQYVTDVDSATVANILIRIEEGRALFHRIAFINMPNEFMQLIDIHKLTDSFDIYATEEEAIRELQDRDE